MVGGNRSAIHQSRIAIPPTEKPRAYRGRFNGFPALATRAGRSPRSSSLSSPRSALLSRAEATFLCPANSSNSFRSARSAPTVSCSLSRRSSRRDRWDISFSAARKLAGGPRWIKPAGWRLAAISPAGACAGKVGRRFQKPPETSRRRWFPPVALRCRGAAETFPFQAGR